MDPIAPLDTGTPHHGHVHTEPRPEDGDFAAALHRAGAGHRPAGRITLGQMLRAYAGPGVVGDPAPAAPRSNALAAPGAPEAFPGVAGPATAPAAPATGSSALGVGPTARPLGVDVNSAYGPRRHPIHGDVRMHHGVDMAAPTGTPVHAFAAGTVTFAGPRGGYGNVVIVEHANGVESRYAHQSVIDVAVGQQVAAGEALGRVGATGTATGPHLHFELRRGGESIDPAPHLP